MLEYLLQYTQRGRITCSYKWFCIYFFLQLILIYIAVCWYMSWPNIQLKGHEQKSKFSFLSCAKYRGSVQLYLTFTTQFTTQFDAGNWIHCEARFDHCSNCNGRLLSNTRLMLFLQISITSYHTSLLHAIVFRVYLLYASSTSAWGKTLFCHAIR